MLEKFLQTLRQIFTVRTYSSDIENYIVARRPQSPADVETYSREYHQRISKGGWL